MNSATRNNISNIGIMPDINVEPLISEPVFDPENYLVLQELQM